MELSFQNLSKLPASFQKIHDLIGAHAFSFLQAEQDRLIFIFLNHNSAVVYQSESVKKFFEFDLEDVNDLTNLNIFTTISIHLSNPEQKIIPLIVVYRLGAESLKINLSKKSQAEFLLIDTRLDPAIKSRDDRIQSRDNKMQSQDNKTSNSECIQYILEDEAILQNAWVYLQDKYSYSQTHSLNFTISSNRNVEIGANACFYDQQFFLTGLDHLDLEERSLDPAVKARDETKRQKSLIKTEIFSKIKLLGESARSMSSGCLLSDVGEFYYEPIQEHFSKRAKSSLNFKVVLDKRAKTFFRGLVILHRDAQQSEAYQENKNLLLNRNARADSEPRLEIVPNDVMCKHGSATAELDKKQLYYIMSRGFSKEEAKTMIVKSFCNPAFPEQEKKMILLQTIPTLIIDHLFTTYFKMIPS